MCFTDKLNYYELKDNKNVQCIFKTEISADSIYIQHLVQVLYQKYLVERFLSYRVMDHNI